MKLIGMMAARNEEWIIGLSARVALMWCDELVILDHAPRDGTRALILDICGEFPDRIHYMREPAPTWTEMEHRQRMLRIARANGATHCAIIDADEILTANLALLPERAFRSEVVQASVAPGGKILQLPLYNLRNGISRYHSNGLWGNRIVSLAFKDSPELGWRGDKFHSREPGALDPFRPILQGDAGVLHFWGASERRLLAKHALYKVTERLRWPHKPVEEIDRMYSWCVTGQQADEPGSWGFKAVPSSWVAPYADLFAKYFDLEAVPWQEAEVDRLVALHGREMFKGLDLFKDRRR